MFGHEKKEEFRVEAESKRDGILVPFMKCACIFSVAFLAFRVIPDTLETWHEEQKYVTVEYEKLESRLLEKKDCFLCGETNRSVQARYRDSDGMGVISLSDWNVTEFEFEPEQGTVFRTINTGNVQIQKDSTASGRRVSASLSWPEGLLPDHVLLEENLCQECLDKVTETLSVRTKEYTEVVPAPFCMVDFQTLRLYSLQDSQTTLSNGEYWVELQHSENTIELKCYYLPNKNK